jgi:hypothetical protein
LNDIIYIYIYYKILINIYKLNNKLSQIEKYRELFFAQYRDYSNKQVNKQVNKPAFGLVISKADNVDVDFID